MTEVAPERTHVVVIGGGYAGTLAANHLRSAPTSTSPWSTRARVFVERIRLAPVGRRHRRRRPPTTATLLGEGIQLVVDTVDRIDTADRAGPAGLGRRRWTTTT